MTAKPRKKAADEVLLDQALQFIVEAPEGEFVEYLKESGDSLDELTRETERGLAIAARASRLPGPGPARVEELKVMEKSSGYSTSASEDTRVINESFVNWTNQSVRKFAGKQDPTVAMSRRVEELTLQAFEKGWTGPPYDPFKLAELLGIKVLPRDDIAEARTIPGPRREPMIEFNSRQPPYRIRFSIAHEITHTFFPDCLERARYRARRSVQRHDDWQLEMLCNIGAAEILMPTGSFAKLRDEKLDITQLMKQRRTLEVSTEAILIRVVKLSRKSVASFVASTRDDSRLRVDYSVFSRAWEPHVAKSIVLPNRSVLHECNAIGFTVKGTEAWSLDGNSIELDVQAVGLPPYPGAKSIRVAGLISPKSPVAQEVFTIEYHLGDALQPRNKGKKVIAQIVNDRTPRWGGGGFAANLKRTWPNIQDDFKSWVEANKDHFRLGSVHVSRHTDDISVVSMVAQHGYGPSENPRIRYAALEQCLEQLANYASKENRSIHMPRIGTGQAGGSWDVIEELIENRICSRGLRVLVYELPR